MTNPLVKRWAVELKVKSMTAVTALLSIALEILNDVKADNSLIPGPSWFQAIVILVIPTVVTFVTGYRTRHTPRSTL